jgi:molybdopterin converting factor small subunit
MPCREREVKVKTMAMVESPLAVKVRFMGDLPAVTGQRKLLVSLPAGETVGGLLDSLSQRYGEDFRSRVFSSPTKLHHTMLIFVDGENITQHGGLGAKLGDSEVEVIMLPMYGGG